MAKVVKNHKSSFFLQAGFFAFSSVIILLIALQGSNQTASFDIRSKAAAPNPVVTKHPNCCGYNKTTANWNCYSTCKTQDVTSTITLYPDKVCQTAAQCK